MPNHPPCGEPLRRRLGVLLFVGLAALPLAGVLAARAPQQDQQGQPPIHVQVSLVNLFVTVRNKHTHQIVSNLDKQDFRVSEDGVPQKIAFFSRQSKLPITLGLLIDTSGSEQNTLPAEKQAAEEFLSHVLRKNDLAMVISFDTDTNLLADFTDDMTTLDNAISRAQINAPVDMGPLPGNPAGTVFYDAVYLACHDELASQAGRKALVILTDAQDEGSRLKLQDAIEAAQRTDTVVHILLIGDPRFGVNEGVAEKLTEETGGRTIVVNSQKDMTKAFEQISEELRSQYTLGYYPTNSKRDGTYRKIKVELKDKNLVALTRRGYYAPRN